MKLSLSSNHYRQITHESPSRGFINCKSKAVWNISKSLYMYTMCVCVWVWASGHIVMLFWTAALILMSLSTSWPTWLRTGLFSTAGRYRRSAEGTARGLDTRTHTQKHTQMLALKHLRAWKHNSIPSYSSQQVSRMNSRVRWGINESVVLCWDVVSRCFLPDVLTLIMIWS